MPKLCLIGLGNPGSKYNNTRHNIGKDWLLSASKKYSAIFSSKEKFQADIAYSHSEEILWVIPNNFVNNSGRTLQKLMRNINITEDKIIIFHDDLDLNPGEVRLKEDGATITSSKILVRLTFSLIMKILFRLAVGGMTKKNTWLITYI